MTEYIATVKIKIDPRAHIDSKYYGYKKSLEEGISTAEANLSSPPTEAEIKLYVRNLVLARFPLDREIKHVSVLEVSSEDEKESDNGKK
jgi:hypothetical protein